jgi:hypothetical protein
MKVLNRLFHRQFYHPLNFERLSNFIPKSFNAWLIIGCFTLISAIGPFVGLAKLINYFFPVGAVLTGLFLYFRYPILYSGFVWWIWFLAAFLRRIVDWRSGFTDPSPILLTPFLVSLISVIGLLGTLPNSYRNRSYVFTFPFITILYAFLIGIVNFSIPISMLSWFEWVSPVVFGSFYFLNWRDYPIYSKHIQKVFLLYVLVSGIYGIYQYLVAPEWDRLWLISTNMLSIGRPEPLGIRVWSIMHSPGVFGPAMMAGLLLLFTNTNPLWIPAMAVGYLSFLLCLVRSSWIGWIVGAFSLVASLKPKLRFRFALIVIIGLTCVIPLITIEPFSSVILPRLQTFSNLSEDGSGQDRQDIYSETIGSAVTNFLGNGLNKSNGFDSGLLTMLLSLGWFGSIVYLGSIILILVQVGQSKYIGRDAFASAARSIVLGIAIQLIFGSSMLGLSGTILWSFAGLSLAAQRYYESQNLYNQVNST